MRIYISGSMTGHPDHNIPAFDAAAKRLREQGHFVINPHELSTLFGPLNEIDWSFKAVRGELGVGVGLEYEVSPRLANAVMDADLAAVRSCDAIYLLNGWEDSRGAKKELAEAVKYDLMVLLEKEKP